jgi:hypothetical protein
MFMEDSGAGAAPPDNSPHPNSDKDVPKAAHIEKWNIRMIRNAP